MELRPPRNLRDLGRALGDAGLDVEAHGKAVAKARGFLLGYARMERRLLGEVPLRFPEHLLGQEVSANPLEAGEDLANRERARLGVGEDAVGDMAHFLDREGLKVYRLELSADSPLEGFTLFDRTVGPAMVVNRDLSPSETDAILARLYGHFLVDYDPYRLRLVVRGVPAESPEDLRAVAFATAFLVPVKGLDRYLEALEEREVSTDTVYHLAVYFETGWLTILTRLLTLGRVEAGDVAGFLERLTAKYGQAPELHETERIPERYVRIALESHARYRFDLDTLARLLETNPASAASLAGRFRLEAPKEEGEDAEEEATYWEGDKDDDS